MKNRWINILVLLLVVMIAGLFWHLFVFAKTSAATSLILNILKPLNILLFTVLFFIISRSLVKLYLGQKRKTPGFRLRTKLVLAILPLTLVPAVIIFFISTRFLDNILLSVRPAETNLAEMAMKAEALNQDHLAEVGKLYLSHAATLDDMLGNNPEGIREYLDKYQIDGLEFYEDGDLKQRLLHSDFPPAKVSRLDETASLIQLPGPRRYDDGFLVRRYDFSKDNRLLRLIYTQQTPFTERFYYIRDSHQYLQHKDRKNAKIREINYGIMLITTLAVIFGGIWTGLSFARPFISAFQALITGAHRVSAGDLSTQIELKTGDELEDVVQAFNDMTVQIKSNREAMEHHAQDLETVNAALSGQIQYSQTILQQIKAGVISTDLHGNIQTYNPAAKNILQASEAEMGQSLVDLLATPAYKPLLERWEAHQTRNFKEYFSQIEIGIPSENKQRVLAISIVPLVEHQTRFGSLLVMEDLTPLLTAQKVAAWREVAKRVAHEIKNPLTPIQLSIQRIKRKAEKGSDDLLKAIHSAHDTIMGETLLLKNLVDEFSTFAKMPTPVRKDLDLCELVTNVCESYSKIHQDRVFKREIPDHPCQFSGDVSQLRQVLNNLINNAAQATSSGDTIQINLIERTDTLRIEVADTGHGIPPEEKSKVFLPYYSKSPKGTGLGLAIVKRIVNDHDGHIRVMDAKPQGTCFQIDFPRQA